VAAVGRSTRCRGGAPTRAVGAARPRGRGGQRPPPPRHRRRRLCRRHRYGRQTGRRGTFRAPSAFFIGGGTGKRGGALSAGAGRARFLAWGRHRPAAEWVREPPPRAAGGAGAGDGCGSLAGAVLASLAGGMRCVGMIVERVHRVFRVLAHVFFSFFFFRSGFLGPQLSGVTRAFLLTLVRKGDG